MKVWSLLALVAVATSGCTLISYTWPGPGVQRISLEKTEERQFARIGVVLDMPVAGGFWTKPHVSYDTTKWLQVCFQPIFPPKGTFDEPIHFVYLSINRMSKDEFDRKFPHGFFNYLPIQECSDLDDKSKAFLQWVSQPHMKTDAYQRETDFETRQGTREEHILVRWFPAGNNEMIFCSGSVFPYLINGKMYLAEDISGLKAIMDSIRPMK